MFRKLLNRFTQSDDVLLSKRKDLAAYRVGRWSYGQVAVVPGGELTVGNFCSFAGGSTIHLSGPNERSVTAFSFDKNVTKPGNVRIGNDVWVGAYATILPNVTVSDGAVVAAQSLVTENVPPYAIVAGNPAKLIKFRFPPETIAELLRIEWWNWSDDKILREMTLMQSDNMEQFIRRHRV